MRIGPANDGLGWGSSGSVIWGFSGPFVESRQGRIRSGSVSGQGVWVCFPSRALAKSNLRFYLESNNLTTIETAMAPLARSVLLPQCLSCLRRSTRFALDAWRPLDQQPVRGLSKAAKKAENTIVVKLRQDVKKFGRKGTRGSRVISCFSHVY